jgi:hypothetical protein
LVDRRVRGSGIGFGVDHQAIDSTRIDKEKTGSKSLGALSVACHIHIAVCNREIHAAAVLAVGSSAYSWAGTRLAYTIRGHRL